MLLRSSSLVLVLALLAVLTCSITASPAGVQSLPPHILCLDPGSNGAMTLLGGVTVDVPRGLVQVNSSAMPGLSIVGTVPRLRARAVRVCGTVSAARGTIRAIVQEHAPYWPDPFAAVPEPDPSGMPNRGSITSPGTYLPGFYPGGIHLSGGTAYLRSGLYVLGSGGLQLSGSAFLTVEGVPDQDGVFLYLRSPGALILTGNAGLRLWRMHSGVYAGISYFQARSNTLTASIGSTGVFEVLGEIYLPRAGLSISGDAGRTAAGLTAWQCTFSGNGLLTIAGS